jgi:ribosomal protein L39E
MKNNQEEQDSQYYIVRGKGAGVWFGKIAQRTGDEVVMTDARRLWRFSGATECAWLSVNGVTRPDQCKFTIWVKTVTVLNVVEFIPCTDKASKSLSEVPAWTP